MLCPPPGNLLNSGVESMPLMPPELAGVFFTTNTTWEGQLHGTAAAKSLQLCPTICDPMDYSPPGSSVHGILQARILEWVAISYSRGSSGPRDQTCVSCDSCIAGGFFTLEPSIFSLGIKNHSQDVKTE